MDRSLHSQQMGFARRIACSKARDHWTGSLCYQPLNQFTFRQLCIGKKPDLEELSSLKQVVDMPSSCPLPGSGSDGQMTLHPLESPRPPGRTDIEVSPIEPESTEFPHRDLTPGLDEEEIEPLTDDRHGEIIPAEVHPCFPCSVRLEGQFDSIEWAGRSG